MNTFLTTILDKKSLNPAFQELYRDKNALVATDGHRLHYIDGLPDATPGYLSGREGTYPNWQLVIPQDPPLFSFTLGDLKSFAAKLKIFKAAIAANKRNKCVQLSVHHDLLVLRYCVDGTEIKIIHELDMVQGCSKEMVMGIDGEYLLEAIDQAAKCGALGMRVAYHDPVRKPLMLDFPTVGKAAIMPMKL